MPCYYDTPDSNNQIEIEKRSMERMFFEACSILDDNQIKIAVLVKLKKYPQIIHEELCKICKILTDEQMSSISAYYYDIKWDHKTLLDWHKKHIIDDETHNGR